MKTKRCVRRDRFLNYWNFEMKVLLLFPPDWLPSEPYLSLPSLTSVLRPAGHDVVQKDINVEMYDLFFSAGFLDTAAERIGRELHHLQVVKESAGIG